MLALRSSFLAAAARRPVLASSYSEVAGFLDALSNDKLPDLDVEPYPPTPGPGAYHNPMKMASIKQHLEVKPKYRLHCHSTSNNTIATLTLADGSTVAWYSGGSCGFKKGNRASYEAGYQCAVKMFAKIEEISSAKPIELDLFFKGFGQGRDALHRALLTSEGDKVRPLVTNITDRTAIKIGGTRAKKTRRL